MNIGILGSGAVGVAMAKGFLAEGHNVWLATREPDGQKGKDLQVEMANATVCDFATAAKEADLAVFCVTWDGAEAAAALIGPENVSGKTVLDASNIIKPLGDSVTYGGEGLSAAEQLQGWLPDAHVVKAFNTVGAATMYKPDFGGEVPTMFIAGDDMDAKRQASDVVSMFGWEPKDAGNLPASRELEAMALVWIRNAMSGAGPHHAFKLL